MASSIASSSTITMFKNLDIKNSDFTIQGRVIRLWRTPNNKRPTDTHTVELILMDAEGSKIQVSIEKQYLKSNLTKYLQEGNSLQISGASLVRNTSSVWFCDNPYKVMWKWSTKINDCEDIGLSSNGLSFASFQDIKHFKHPFKVSFDICGYITNVSEVKMRQINGKENKCIMMNINDIDGTTLDLTLWNEYCDQLTNYKIENPDIQPVVVILQFAKYKEWSGNASLSNMYYGTKLLINTNSKEIQELTQSLLSKIENGSLCSQSLSCETVVNSINNEFLVMHEFNCIAEINMLKKVQTVILLGTIKNVEKESCTWYYLGCSYCMCKVDQVWTLCSKEVGSQETILKSEITCGSEKCKTRTTSIVPRFRITVALQDSTGVCFLTLFDQVATKLLNISATDLMSRYDKDHNNDVFWPTELDTLVNKKLAFKVEVAEYNKTKPSNYFKVLKYTDDTEVIEKLNQKLIELKDSDSFSFDMEDQQTIKSKESVSITDQNETPGSVCYKDSKAVVFADGVDGGMTSSNALKRNLNEVYDVDDYEANSSTKVRNISSQGLNVTPTQKLLVPKLEKK